jgi:hypothetical protein
MTVADVKKAIGALLAGILAWATAVVVSPESAITAAEWIVLAGVVVTVVTVYVLKNADPAPAE